MERFLICECPNCRRKAKFFRETLRVNHIKFVAMLWFALPTVMWILIAADAFRLVPRWLTLGVGMVIVYVTLAVLLKWVFAAERAAIGGPWLCQRCSKELRPTPEEVAQTLREAPRNAQRSLQDAELVRQTSPPSPRESS